MYSSSRARYMYRYSKAIYSSSIDSPALYCSYRALCSSFRLRALYSYSITHLEPSQITSLVPTTAPLELSTAPFRVPLKLCTALLETSAGLLEPSAALLEPSGLYIIYSSSRLQSPLLYSSARALCIYSSSTAPPLSIYCSSQSHLQLLYSYSRALYNCSSRAPYYSS